MCIFIVDSDENVTNPSIFLSMITLLAEKDEKISDLMFVVYLYLFTLFVRKIVISSLLRFVCLYRNIIYPVF